MSRLILKRLVNYHHYSSCFIFLNNVDTKIKILGFQQFHHGLMNFLMFRNLSSKKLENKKPLHDYDSMEYEDRNFETLTVDQFKPLFESKGENLKVRVKRILDYYEHEKYTTMLVPTKLTQTDMSTLLQVFDDEKEFQRTLKFFYTRECEKYTSKKKYLLKRKENKEKKIEKYGSFTTIEDWKQGIWSTESNPPELVYGLWHNSLLSRINKQSVRDFRYIRMNYMTALFGQKLIIDLSYDQYMKLSEINLLAQQAALSFYQNRINRDFPTEIPFDIHFTNCKIATKTMSALSKHIKRMDQFGAYFHSKSYLELKNIFPRQRLVYLSPHASNPLRKFSHDDIYILGGYNDKNTHLHVSHIKADTEGIKCFRLPLDEHVLWKQGNKNLCLNQVIAILHAVKATDDWKMAISNFSPQRKVKSSAEEVIEEQIRMKKIAKRLRTIQKTHKLEYS